MINTFHFISKEYITIGMFSLSIVSFLTGMAVYSLVDWWLLKKIEFTVRAMKEEGEI